MVLSLLVMVLVWLVFTFGIQTTIAIMKWRYLTPMEGAHFAAHILSCILFLISCVFVWMKPAFMFGYANLYCMFMMILHAPSSQNLVRTKADPTIEKKDVGGKSMSIHRDVKREFHSVLDVNRNDLRVDAL